MINLNTSPLTNKQLKGCIEKKIKHHFIDQFIDHPVIDEEKLSLLSMILSNTPLSLEKQQQYIVATMLVQLALDTHDIVEKQTNNTTKQLTVLAGDYYSGLYYLLLSEIEELDFIHTLATAIRDINELKMKIHLKEIKSMEEYLSTVQQINSLLLIRVAKYVDHTLMASITGELLFTSKLVQEKQEYHMHGNSKILTDYLQVLNLNMEQTILDDIDHFVLKNTTKIDSFVFPSSFQLSALHENIQSILNPLVAHVEEG